jgi:hypothetical protein
MFDFLFFSFIFLGIDPLIQWNFAGYCWKTFIVVFRCITLSKGHRNTIVAWNRSFFNIWFFVEILSVLLGIRVKLLLQIIGRNRCDILSQEALLSIHDQKFIQSILQNMILIHLLIAYVSHLLKHEVEHLLQELHVLGRRGSLKVRRRNHV